MVPALRNGRIHIHCFWFDIYTGEIWCFSRKDKTFIMINEESVGDLQVNIKIVLRLVPLARGGTILTFLGKSLLFLYQTGWF